MSDTILTALIAGGVSLVVAGIGLFAAVIQFRSNVKKIQREFEHSFSNKLYEQRIKHYPKGFQIAGFIYQRKKPELLDPPEKIREICNQLVSWAEGEAGLYFSWETVRAYFDLREALLKNPGAGDNYTERQAEKVWAARVEFRRQLRRDIGNLHRSARKHKIPTIAST